jgi:DNA-binding CsgD family transcriptional regulator
MGRLSEADLRATFGFLATARLGGRRDPIPAPTLAALRDLLHADAAEYFEFRRADRTVLGIAESDPVPPVPGSDETMHAFGHENPLNWRRWTPAHGAIRLSARVRRREFERTGFYDGFMRPNDLHDTLKVWLSTTGTSTACIQLWRGGTDFSRRDQDVLAVLQHHLIAMRSRALRGVGGRRSAEGLTVREAEILTWTARGESDVAIATRLGIARATVNKHLEHAYAALGVHSRAEAIGRILVPEADD